MMNRSRDEFVRRWRAHVAGMALFGLASEVKDGPLVRANKILDIPQEVESLLGKMYDDLVPVEVPQPLPVRAPGSVVNGAGPKKVVG